MDSIIFRSDVSRFVRLSNGDLFLTGDTEELTDEMNKEKVFHPVAFSISYEDKTREDGTEYTMATIWNANREIGVFVFSKGDDNGLREALKRFADTFEGDTSKTLKEWKQPNIVLN